MIVYDLICAPEGHRFEGWFGSSDDFAQQQARGLVTCPDCGTQAVGKAPMAPAVGRKGNQLAPIRPLEQATPAPTSSPSSSAMSAPTPAPVRSQPMASGDLPAQAAKVLHALAAMQAEALKSSRWVGKNFAEQTRAQHYGESEAETIHGEATLAEAKDLLEEGIAVMPLPFPVAPPDETH